MKYYNLTDEHIVEVCKVDEDVNLYLSDKINRWEGIIINGFIFFPMSRGYEDKYKIKYSELPEDYKNYIKNPFFKIDVRKTVEKYKR